jgi:DNA-binding MarR family transcriptional regulator
MSDRRAYLLERIADTNRRLFRRYVELGSDHDWTDVDLTMPQLKVLFLVGASSDGVSMTRVSRGAGMTLSTATGVVDRLVSHGLIRRENDVADRRVVLLYATPDGAALVERLSSFGHRNRDIVMAQLTEDELELVSDAQNAVYRAAFRMSVPVPDGDSPAAKCDQPADSTATDETSTGACRCERTEVHAE